MAFFTRVNTNVPYLPPEQCHSEDSLLGTESQGTKSEIKSDVRNSTKGVENQTEESGRFEYVVDRVLGVEV